ncbi:hypothetical protein LCGC14_1050980 [marine sediment metagenome]|uniref:Uncharacterized protein n=1 Tax=marine sediment metagenome TaxID=412755 RepID=A0A0F9MNT9_9ZZZZ
MANTNITIAKGTLTVTIQTLEVVDNYSNKLFLITPPQSAANQASGPKNVKIVDLLRITHTIVIRGVITPGDDDSGVGSANSAKDDLISIYKGASTAGGTTTLTYDEDTFNGYIEKLTVTEKTGKPSDFDSSPTIYPEVIGYEIAITFVEGTTV